MEANIFTGQRIWCPLCKELHRFLRIPNAARLLEVNRRTIYRHIEDGSVHVFKLGGNGRYRVCSGCLLAHPSVSGAESSILKAQSEDRKQAVTRQQSHV